MRSFPRTAKRLVVAITATSALGALCVPVADASSHAKHLHHLKDRQKHANAAVKAAKGDLDESSTALREAEAALDSAQSQLVDARTHLADVNAQLTAAVKEEKRLQAALEVAKDRLTQAQADLADGQQAVDEQKDRVRRNAVATLTAGNSGVAQVGQLLQAATPADLIGQIEYGQVVNGAAANSYAQLEAAEVVLKVKEQQVADATAEVADEEQQAEEHVAQVTDLQEQAVQAEKDVKALVVTRKSARLHAIQVKHHDQKVLAAEKKKAEQIKQKILWLKRHDRNRTVADTGGLLMRPVPGYITSPYGWRIQPIYGYSELHDGDDFHAPCGSPEVAAGNGKIVSEYYSSSWGYRLILDLGNINGHNFTVIYNHISQYVAHYGQYVQRGQTVALAGTTGWSTGCHLHFTVMVDGVAQNPMNYIAG